MKYIDADKLKAEIERRRLSNRYIDTESYEAELFDIIDSFQQKPQEEICSKCIHHGKDDGYCYNPYGGMQYRINENGVCECTGFCEKEQEQPKVDLEREAVAFCFDNGINITPYQATRIARHFYELGLKTRKEE